MYWMYSFVSGKYSRASRQAKARRDKWLWTVASVPRQMACEGGRVGPCGESPVGNFSFDPVECTSEAMIFQIMTLAGKEIGKQAWAYGLNERTTFRWRLHAWIFMGAHWVHRARERPQADTAGTVSRAEHQRSLLLDLGRDVTFWLKALNGRRRVSGASQPFQNIIMLRSTWWSHGFFFFGLHNNPGLRGEKNTNDWELFQCAKQKRKAHE